MNKAQRAVLGDCFNLEPFVEIMAFLIRKISPKMTFLKDTSTDYQVFTRPRTAEELRFNNESRMTESRLPVRGENQMQMVDSTRKRKRSTVAMSPTRNNNSHLEIPATVTSPDFGSCPRPEQLYDPDTPMIEIRTVPQRRQIQTLIDYGYTYTIRQIQIKMYLQEHLKKHLPYHINLMMKMTILIAMKMKFRVLLAMTIVIVTTMVILVMVIIVTKVQKNMIMNRN